MRSWWFLFAVELNWIVCDSFKGFPCTTQVTLPLTGARMGGQLIKLQLATRPVHSPSSMQIRSLAPTSS